MTALAAALERVNPILLKEVRASLRARIFRILFQIVTAGSVIVALAVLVDRAGNGATELGLDVFMPVYLCLCVTVLGVVPLSAFFNLGAEWDESTYDLLAISNLRPRQIVLGKLLSSTVEALLYFCAFAPLLVMTFLLRGLDPGAIVLVLAITFGLSIGASSAALGISSLARGRVWRLLLLLVLAGGVLVLVIATSDEVWGALRSAGAFRWTDDRRGIVAIVVVAGLLGFTTACERLAHPEENHSTGPRAVVTGMYALLLAWCVWLSLSFGGLGSFQQPAGAMLALATLAQMFFVTERDDLSRRVCRSVPRNGVLAFLSVPFLPGGGRALVLFGVHVLMGLLAGAIAMAIQGRTAPAGDAFFPNSSRYLAFAGYLFLYLAGVSLPFSRVADRVHLRWAARIVLPIVFLLVLFMPVVVGFGRAGWRGVDWNHAFNPFHVLDRHLTAARFDQIFAVIGSLAVILFLANLRRIDRAFREVMRASRENRARAKERG